MLSLLILVPLIGIVILNLSARAPARRLAFWFALLIFISQILLAACRHPVLWNASMVGKLCGGWKFLIIILDFIKSLCYIIRVGVVQLVDNLV